VVGHAGQIAVGEGFSRESHRPSARASCLRRSVYGDEKKPGPAAAPANIAGSAAWVRSVTVYITLPGLLRKQQSAADMSAGPRTVPMMRRPARKVTQLSGPGAVGPRRTGAGAGSADRDVERPPLPASRLRRTPVVPLLGPLLACWSFSDICSGSAPTPGPHCDNGKAHDDEKDPDQKQDIADLVDVESRSMHCDSEPQDGSNDHQHEPERRHTDA
jgi:hypothetical protein